MAFQEKVLSLGTTETLVFECPVTLSGSVHGLVFSNITGTDKNLTLKVYTKSTGVTTIVAQNRKVVANGEFAWPKPINMAAGDQIIAQADALNSITCLASVYLAVSQAVSAGFTVRGTHSVIENYVPNDVVAYLGTSYVAISPNINSVPPSSAWMPLAAKGDTGASASIQVKDEGTNLTTAVTEFNFTGAGATASVVGSVVTIDIPANAATLGSLGIPNVENKSSAMIRSEINSSNVTTALGFTPLNAATLGAALGPAPLGADSKIAALYLPSYVDDVLEGTLALFPATGEVGKIYVDTTTNKQYRWSGSVYTEINPSPGSTDAVPEGTTNKYFTANRVLTTVLSGISFATNAAITAADTVVSALGNLQAQLTALISTVNTKAPSANPTFTGAVTFPSQAANVFFAGPNGASGVPTWRGLVTADLPALGAATATTINKVTITAPATGSTLTIANGKTLTVNNSLTFSGTDASTLDIGTGGTLGTAAYTSASSYAPSSGASSITIVGTIGTGTWQGTVVAGTYGGTGANNGARTISYAGNVAFAGAFATSITVTAATTVTLPTSGNILSSATAVAPISGTPSASNFLCGDGTWKTPATGTGTVTSVGLTLPSIFSVSGSPITGAGTLSASLASQLQALVFASPSGATGAPTFRALVASDIPALSYAPVSGSANYLAPSAIGTTVQAYDADLTAWAGKTAPTGTVVGTTDTQTLTGKSLQGAKEVSATLSGTTPVITASNGTLLTWNLTGPSTPTSTLADGEYVLLKISDGTAYTITWTSVGVVWKDGTAPTLATTGYTAILLWKQGTVVNGAKLGDFAS